MELLPGYLVVHHEEGKVVWEARDLSDCRASAKNFKDDILNSMKNRINNCIHSACTALEKCLDLHGIFLKICGERFRKKAPYDKVTLAQHGVDLFRDFVDFVINLPHVREYDSQTIDPVLSHSLYDKLKETLVSTINIGRIAARCWNQIFSSSFWRAPEYIG
jgi:hypothetical protein